MCWWVITFFVIFAVLDVSLAVNLCINRGFFTFIIIINEKINVAFSHRTTRTQSQKNTSRENVVSNSTEEEEIVMKMTAQRAVSSAAA